MQNYYWNQYFFFSTFKFLNSKQSPSKDESISKLILKGKAHTHKWFFWIIELCMLSILLQISLKLPEKKKDSYCHLKI